MIVDIFVAAYLIGMLLGIFAVIKGKGHGVILAILATVLAAFTSPLIVLLICLFFVNTKEGSYWDE